MTDWPAAIRTIEHIITGTSSQEADMNETITSPEVQSEGPLWLQPLIQRVRETKDDEVEPVCEWLGIPKPSDCPTPGKARVWTKDEWIDWAKPLGFTDEGEATHGYIWRHPKAHTIVLSMMKNSSEFRAWMNMASELRNRVREVATRCNNIFRYSIRSGGLTKADFDEETFKQFILDKAQSRDERDQHMTSAVGAETASKSLKDLTNVFDRILKDFNVQPRAVLRAIYSDSPATADALYEKIKLMPADAQVGVDLVEAVRDYLENLRETERGEREEKQAKRDREDAERKARQEAKHRPKTATEIIREQIRAREDANLNSIRTCALAAQATLDRLRSLEIIASKSLEIAEVEDPAPIREALIARNQEIAALKDNLNLLQATHDIDQQTIAKMSARVSEARLKQLEDTETHLHLLASLVVDSVEKAKTVNNPFQLSELLTNLSKESQAFIQSPVDASEKASK
jgi:hypothetical protein